MFPWRRQDASTYLIVLTEILVQQTRAESVASILPKFLRSFPNWNAIARASICRLETQLRRLGLWRRRARALKNLAKDLRLKKHQWPKKRHDLEKMPAVGQYVASAVLLFVHHRREPLLDVNMARVLERYFGPRTLADIRYDPYLQNLARRLINCSKPVFVNWAVMDLGAIHCTASRPKCELCPIRIGCKTNAKLSK